MRTPLIKTFQFILVVSTIIFLTCQKDENNLSQTDLNVSFSVQVQNDESSANLKSGSETYSLSDASKIIITIANKDGSPTIYTSHELKIQKMNGNYYTNTIVLKSGDYKLTEFLVLSYWGTTLFVAPLIGSTRAQNVNNPLPIQFSVSKNSSSSVPVEVLSVENYKPEDFGLSFFNFSEVNTFSFLIGVIDNKSRKLISADITVKNENYTYRQTLEKITNNVVNIKNNMNAYTLYFKSKGYNSYSRTYSLEELKSHLNKPGNVPILIPLHQSAAEVKDIDGNEYNTVKIGDQIWMAENLKTTRYKDGTPIPQVVNNTTWGSLTKGAYCWVNNIAGNSSGKLYNWYTINDKLCPAGWHVPDVNEFNKLSTAIDGKGGSLKDTVNWMEHNFGATNETGFSAFPNGLREIDGEFYYQNEINFTWLSSESDSLSTHAIQWYIYFFYTGIIKSEYDKRVGAGIRCIKD